MLAVVRARIQAGDANAGDGLFLLREIDIETLHEIVTWAKDGPEGAAGSRPAAQPVRVLDPFIPRAADRSAAQSF